VKRATVDYYHGAYGPTLRVDVRSALTLAKLRNLFADLAQGKKQEVDLCTLEWVKSLSSVRAILLRVLPVEREPYKTLELLSTGLGGATFRWARYAEGWLECAELLDGLSGPGHQYLTHASIDDASVEVVFKEYPRQADSDDQ